MFAYSNVLKENIYIYCKLLNYYTKNNWLKKYFLHKLTFNNEVSHALSDHQKMLIIYCDFYHLLNFLLKYYYTSPVK